jgi:hypothetical protein
MRGHSQIYILSVQTLISDKVKPEGEAEKIIAEYRKKLDLSQPMS